MGLAIAPLNQARRNYQDGHTASSIAWRPGSVWRVRTFPRRVSTIHILGTNHPHLPNAAAREELARLHAAYSDFVVCNVVLIPLKGFLASALRGLVTAILLHESRRLPVVTKVMSTPEAVAEWLAPMHAQGTGVSISASTVEQALLPLYEQA